MSFEKMTSLLCSTDTRHLVVGPDKVVWNPAGSEPGVTSTLLRYGFSVLSTDAGSAANAEVLDGVQDFLEVQSIDPGIELIVARPPKEYIPFAEHALNLTRRVDGGVLLLLPEELYRHTSFHNRFVKGFSTFVTRFAAPEISDLAWFYWDWRERAINAVPRRLLLQETASCHS